jgi:hypothetical protein
MHKILALAQNVGGLSKYRLQILAANVGGKAVQNCKITAPHDIPQKQGGR